jgi:hypothetical protein
MPTLVPDKRQHFSFSGFVNGVRYWPFVLVAAFTIAAQSHIVILGGLPFVKIQLLRS